MWLSASLPACACAPMQCIILIRKSLSHTLASFLVWAALSALNPIQTDNSLSCSRFLVTCGTTFSHRHMHTWADGRTKHMHVDCRIQNRIAVPRLCCRMYYFACYIHKQFTINSRCEWLRFLISFISVVRFFFFCWFELIQFILDNWMGITNTVRMQ